MSATGLQVNYIDNALIHIRQVFLKKTEQCLIQFGIFGVKLGVLILATNSC